VTIVGGAAHERRHDSATTPGKISDSLPELGTDRRAQPSDGRELRRNGTPPAVHRLNWSVYGVFTGRRRELLRRSGPRSAVDEDVAQFVAERSAALLRTAWLLTGDAGRAEDLLLTALSAAWAKWAWVLGGGPPEEYVRRVLVTRYLSGQRRRFKAPTSVLPEAGPAHDEVVRSADRDAVRRVLAGLTRQQRAVVVLRYVEDLPVAETADVLGCSAATVRVQAGRALAAFRIDPHVTPFVNEDEIGQRLLDAVPTLSEPPDRLAVLRGRATDDDDVGPARR
jgi:RNA polymerase sigma-70 factor (sigma-E family)